jgi:hypothetical protein
VAFAHDDTGWIGAQRLGGGTTVASPIPEGYFSLSLSFVGFLDMAGMLHLRRAEPGRKSLCQRGL